MPVKPLKTQPRCKICMHDRRAEIDEVLHLRATHGKLPDGKVAMLTPVLEHLAGEYGVENPTKENIDTHWKKHCEVVETQEEALGEQNAIRDAIEAELGEDWDDRILNYDEVLKILFSFESKKLIKSLIRGDALQGAAVERVLKMSQELNKQGGSNAVDELNEALAQAAAGGPE